MQREQQMQKLGCRSAPGMFEWQQETTWDVKWTHGMEIEDTLREIV